MKEHIILFFKGLAMGAANVIPGVSGGTIAFITGIYETLINAIKSFNPGAAKLLLSGNFKGFSVHIHLPFLLPLFLGIGFSILTLARLFEYLFAEHETLTLSFFFGLIIASVYLVGKEISAWKAGSILLFLLGAFIAGGIAVLNPANPNEGFVYVFICGIVAVSSMILPGLSGSYVLLMMGNYTLVLNAISEMRFNIIIPLALGCVVGLVGFSHLLSYIFKNYRDAAIGLLTGFVFGSLLIIWPWKNSITEEVAPGKVKTIAYEWLLPVIDTPFFMALGLILLGIALVVGMERAGNRKTA